MLIARFVTRTLMLRAAEGKEIDVDRLSFKGAFQIIKKQLIKCNASNEVLLTQW